MWASLTTAHQARHQSSGLGGGGRERRAEKVFGATDKFCPQIREWRSKKKFSARNFRIRLRVHSCFSYWNETLLRLWGGTSSNLGARNAFQWHRACYFLLGYNLRSGAHCSLGGLKQWFGGIAQPQIAIQWLRACSAFTYNKVWKATYQTLIFRVFLFLQGLTSLSKFADCKTILHRNV